MVSSGGRVLAVVGTGDDLDQARERAYAGIGRISLPGSFYRTDIAAAAARARQRLRMIGNVLANRYASPAMRDIWSAESKIIAERRLWLAVLAAQNDLGVDLAGDDPEAVLAAYQAVLDQVDLASIAEREKITRHDVKARIEEFNALAGYEHVHKGMTSRDLTENVEQLQIVSALRIIRDRMVSGAGPARRAGRPATPTRPIAGAHAQRRGPDHHPGQAVRDRGGGAADRATSGSTS